MQYYDLFSDKEIYITTTMVDKETIITVEPHLTETTEHEETNTRVLHTTISESINDLTEHLETSTDIVHTTQSESNDFSRLTTRSSDHYKEISTANISRQQSTVARTTRNPTKDIILSHTTSTTATETTTERNDNLSIAPVIAEMPSENITTTVLYKTIVTTQSKVISKAKSDVFPEENLATKLDINIFVSFCTVLSCCHMTVG